MRLAVQRAHGGVRRHPDERVVVLDLQLRGLAGHPAQAVLQRQLTALSRLTDDLLDAARVVTGNLPATRHPLDLSALVHAALDDLPAHLQRPAVTVPSEPVMIDGDPVRLGQMLANLLDNARKHTEDTAVVTVDLGVRGGQAELRVRDTGPGFDPALADTLFDPFMRVDTGAISSVRMLSMAWVCEMAAISRAPPSKPPALDERGPSRPSTGAVSARGALGSGGRVRGAGMKPSSLATAWLTCSS